jgi:DNA-binding NarL/FixJ family response regulator
VGTATDGVAFLWVAAQALPAGVVVIDVAMTRWNGLEAGRKMMQGLPQAKLVFLTMHKDPVLARQARREEASAHLLRTCAAAKLLQWIYAAIKVKNT